MAAKKPLPRILTVKSAWHLTPNMIRVTFSGDGLEGLPEGRASANCKLMLPEPGESRPAFLRRLEEGPAPVRRTYTVRHHRPDAGELDIDFVDHGDAGPASAWARQAAAGAFLGFAGPGPVKVKEFVADYYVLAADMSAIPVVAATLEAMPADARGLALFEITAPEDRQDLVAPPGIDLRWYIHATPSVTSSRMIDEIRAMPWPDGRVQTCIAGEHEAIRAIRDFLLTEKRLPREDTYISGYWKIGLVEEEHQDLKRTEAA
ncbi:MAG: siderophore-interacting protein [Pseudomonadota bacterium]